MTDLKDDLIAKAAPLELTQSEAYWRRAQGLIPAGTQTFSKGPTQFVNGVSPKYLRRGSGCRVWDVDGNEYIDYPMALGPIVLGYQYPATDQAIAAQLKDGAAFTLMHPLEVEVSELISQIIPCADSVRFGKNGSDVTTGAIRLARAYTGREKIAHCGYHGWHDWYVASTSRNKGVPKFCFGQQFGFDYNDLESLKRIFASNPGEIAAVIMEPYAIEEPKNDFLSRVRDVAHENGAVLIFDEVASGFRYHLGGVHQRFGVDPDLACFGKAMANGMPLAALVGRRKIMSLMSEIFYSFTFGGECLSLAACKATITEMKEKPVIDHIWRIGALLQSGVIDLIKRHRLDQVVACPGMAPRSYLIFRDGPRATALELKSLFQQEVIRRGILFNGAHMVTFSHQEADIKQTLAAYDAALALLNQALEAEGVSARLDGDPLQPVFRPVK